MVTIRAEIDRAIGRLEAADKIVPQVLDALAERRANIGTTNGSSGIRASGHSDPTSRLAAQLADIDRHRQMIAQGVQLIHAAINHLDLTCRQAYGGHLADADEAPRCPGYPIGNDCGDLTTYTLDTRHGPVLRSDRMCDRCARELESDERRQRRAHQERLRYRAGITAG